jgi:hypothetical protein
MITTAAHDRGKRSPAEKKKKKEVCAARGEGAFDR